jgi:anthranilate synthase/aminodeoxychorismate synthase-like glutamine amidotransferase
VLLVDNYDSFTFNVVQLLAELGASVDVIPNDSPIPEHLAQRWTHVVLSPGPGRPEESGICMELARAALAGKSQPLLGVCLGHQVICQIAGAHVGRAGQVMHGKTSKLQHDQGRLFAGLPQGFEVMRYHSLVVDRSTLPTDLRCSAWTEKGEVMAVEHAVFPVFGVQFHPESIGSVYGHELMGRFLASTRS